MGLMYSTHGFKQVHTACILRTFFSNHGSEACKDRYILMCATPICQMLLNNCITWGHHRHSFLFCALRIKCNSYSIFD
jgi:hypothetical protein